MAKTEPLKIKDIVFDALLSYERTYEATAPDYPVETGFSVQDTIILSPLFIDIVGFITDTPLNGRSQRGRVERIAKQLEKMFETKELVTVTTSKGIYRNMRIVSMTLPYKAETKTSMEVPIKFKQIRYTTARTVTIPATYGMSGATGASAGAANTQAGASGSSGKEESKKNQSVLYGLAGGLLN